MQNVLSTQTSRSSGLHVIVGIAIIVGKSSRGAGRKSCATVSPYGLADVRIFGRSPYRRGFKMRRQAIVFSLRDGILFVAMSRKKYGSFTTVLSSKLTHIEASFRTFISFRCLKHPNGLKTWLCYPVLDIKLRRSR